MWYNRSSWWTGEDDADDDVVGESSMMKPRFYRWSDIESQLVSIKRNETVRAPIRLTRLS